MGLTTSYEEFMRDEKAESASFGAYQSASLDDTALFSRLYRQDVERKRIHARVSFDRDAVFISKAPKDTTMDSLKASDDASKAVQKTPWRVSLAAMERRIVSEEVIRPESLPHMTIVVIVLDNGYALQGMSAPADPENFNEELGIKFAREDALRKMWPLEAYVMRDQMTGFAEIHDPQGRWSE